MPNLSRILHGSVARAILLSLLAVSIVPIAIVAFIFIQQSSTALIEEATQNLIVITNSRANEINLRLRQIQDKTGIAAYSASTLLQGDVDAATVAKHIERYKPDQRNIVGLDEFYRASGGQDALGTNLSNVYWNGALDPKVSQAIVQTEALDQVFAGIKTTSPETQWIYLSTKDGMMRLFPWASNDQYPDKWDPREVVFYTVAEPAFNPALDGQWTAPYVDFAGAGWMVTYSTPVLDKNRQFLGIMSQDITIDALKRLALDTRVLNNAGYGFLIDVNGDVIAHPKYGADASADAQSNKGDQDKVNLLKTGTPDFRLAVRDMLAKPSGTARFTSEDGKEQLLVYSRVDAIDWDLGVVVPYEEVIRPAIDMRNRALAIAGLVMLVVILISFLLTRQITRPLRQLMQRVNQLREKGQADNLALNSFSEINELSGAFNVMATAVRDREQNLKSQVRELKIQIDSQLNRDQVASITETDYFKRLEVNAERLRQNVKTVNGHSAASPA